MITYRWCEDYLDGIHNDENYMFHIKKREDYFIIGLKAFLNFVKIYKNKIILLSDTVHYLNVEHLETLLFGYKFKNQNYFNDMYSGINCDIIALVDSPHYEIRLKRKIKNEKTNKSRNKTDKKRVSRPFEQFRIKAPWQRF